MLYTGEPTEKRLTSGKRFAALEKGVFEATIIKNACITRHCDRWQAQCSRLEENVSEVSGFLQTEPGRIDFRCVVATIFDERLLSAFRGFLDRAAVNIDRT